jgi:hypothetical protein
MVERAFRASTIADMLSEATPSIPLVDVGNDDLAAARAAEAAFPVAAGERVTLRVRKRGKGAGSA